MYAFFINQQKLKNYLNFKTSGSQLKVMMLTKVRLNDLPEWLEGESPKLFECIKKDYQLH